MGLEFFGTDVAYKAGWIIALVLGGLHIFSLRRYLFRSDHQWKFIFGHQHKWECVTNLGYEGGGFEEMQVCECGSRRKVQFWPPT